MSREPILLRKSPFVFLKSLILIEFILTIVPFVIAWLVGAQQSYESTTLADTVSYPLLLALVITFMQVSIISVAFVSWYFPTYEINRSEIIHRRSNLFEDRTLAQTQMISDIIEHQGPIGRRLNYGSLKLILPNSAEPALMRDIPDPARHAGLIEHMIDSWEPSFTLDIPGSLQSSLSVGENQFVEYKSSLVWDYHRQMANKELYVPVMKNLAAFMNGSGGVLLIGIADNGEVLGLDKDLSTLPKSNMDGFENVFNQAFNKMIGVEFRQYIDVTFPEVEHKTICMISVRPSPSPAYLFYKGDEKFYIRAGNASQALTVSKATKYIQGRFDD